MTSDPRMIGGPQQCRHRSANSLYCNKVRSHYSKSQRERFSDEARQHRLRLLQRQPFAFDRRRHAARQRADVPADEERMSRSAPSEQTRYTVRREPATEAPKITRRNERRRGKKVV